MKKSKSLLNLAVLFTLTLSFISCTKGPVFENYVKMKNTTWDRFDIKEFTVPIAEAAKSYDIQVVVRCTEKFQYDNLPFYVILTTPAGEERMREVTVTVKENGKLVIDPETSKVESRLILWKNISMADVGKCKITLENMIPKIQTEGIDEIGIVVTEVE